MSIDLSGLSPKQLSALIKTAQKRRSVVAKRAPITKVRSALIKAAKAEGYTIDELFGSEPAPVARGRKPSANKPGPKPGRKLGKVPPKYRNPANVKQTWTGRGKRPRWFAELVDSGKKAEDFLIKKK